MNKLEKINLVLLIFNFNLVIIGIILGSFYGSIIAFISGILGSIGFIIVGDKE